MRRHSRHGRGTAPVPATLMPMDRIIDWSTADVWQYIRDRGIRYCSLYDEGQARVGCVLCPMTRDTARQIARWPKLAAAWERAIKATWKQGRLFPSPEAYWRWWIDRDATGSDYAQRDSPVLFEDDPAMQERPVQP